MSKLGCDLDPGSVIPAGTFVLLSSGEYSSYSVWGIFRAATDVTVPTKNPKARDPKPDIEALSRLLEEVPYVEVWKGDYE